MKRLVRLVGQWIDQPLPLSRVLLTSLVVQQMLGHKSATMTLDLYGHLFPDRLDVVEDALDAARAAALVAPVLPKPVVVDIDAKRRNATTPGNRGL